MTDKKDFVSADWLAGDVHVGAGPYDYAHTLRVEPPAPATDEQKQELRAAAKVPSFADRIRAGWRHERGPTAAMAIGQALHEAAARQLVEVSITLPGQIVGPVTCSGTVRVDAPALSKECPCGIFRGDCEYHR
jgi:hypothetical protein